MTKRVIALLLMFCLIASPIYADEEQPAPVAESATTEEMVQTAADEPSIVVISDRIYNDYDAEEVLHDGEKYVLTFENDEDMEAAYAEMFGEYDCFINEKIDASALTSIDCSSSVEWGYEYMNFDNTTSYDGDLTVAIIDSGINYQHEFFSDSDRLLPGYDFGDSDEDCSDIMGHGTGMASIIYDCTPRNVKILPVKVWDEDNMTTLLQIRLGFEWAVENGADIINMSFETKSYRMSTGEMIPVDYLDSAIEDAHNKGVVMVASAGNDGSYITYHYPACNDRTVAVSAIDGADDFCDFSNWGNAVDFCAPGANILMAEQNGGYHYADGTSMSAPHMCSAFAVLKLENPDATPQDLYELAKAKCIDFGDIGWDMLYGWGCVVFGDRVLHSAELDFSNTTYTGSRITQSAKTKVYGEVNGRILALRRNVDYAVTYSHNTTVGTASMIISGIGDYTGQIVKTFKINPQPTSIKNISSTNIGKVKLSWKSQKKKTSGYQIQYSTSKDFSSDVNKKNVNDNTILEKTIGGLQSGKTYYVRIRTFKRKDDGTYYSDWSEIEKIKVK